MKINQFKNQGFVLQKNFRTLTICVRNFYVADMQRLLNNPDYFLNQSTGPFFKSEKGDTTTIGVINVAGKKLVIKRYNIKSVWHFLKKCWRPSCAMRSWLSIYKLRDLQIDTLSPVAIIEKRFGLLRSKAYLITEYLEGIRACDYFAKHIKQTSQWPIVIKNIVNIAKKLQQARLRHHDFQYGNMHVLADGKVVLLDLDHMQKYHNNWLFCRVFRKDVQHFLDFVKSNMQALKLFQEEFDKLI